MITLYLKTHKITGLKYLGKTTKNPFTYKGSGQRWLNHIRKYGYEVLTEILFQSESENEIKEMGIYYSNLWNIIENKQFANLKLEDGSGGDTSMCENYKLSINKRNLNGNNNPMFGRSAIKEKNLKWYHNGTDTIYITEGMQPKGYCPGRIIKSRKKHTAETRQKIGKKRSKKCMSPKGEMFDSYKQAAEHYNVTTPAIAGLIKRNKSGWTQL